MVDPAEPQGSVSVRLLRLLRGEGGVAGVSWGLRYVWLAYRRYTAFSKSGRVLKKPNHREVARALGMRSNNVARALRGLGQQGLLEDAVLADNRVDRSDDRGEKYFTRYEIDRLLAIYGRTGRRKKRQRGSHQAVLCYVHALTFIGPNQTAVVMGEKFRRAICAQMGKDWKPIHAHLVNLAGLGVLCLHDKYPGEVLSLPKEEPKRGEKPKTEKTKKEKEKRAKREKKPEKPENPPAPENPLAAGKGAEAGTEEEDHLAALPLSELRSMIDEQKGEDVEAVEARNCLRRRYSDRLRETTSLLELRGALPDSERRVFAAWVSGYTEDDLARLDAHATAEEAEAAKGLPLTEKERRFYGIKSRCLVDLRAVCSLGREVLGTFQGTGAQQKPLPPVKDIPSDRLVEWGKKIADWWQETFIRLSGQYAAVDRTEWRQAENLAVFLNKSRWPLYSTDDAEVERVERMVQSLIEVAGRHLTAPASKLPFTIPLIQSGFHAYRKEVEE